MTSADAPRTVDGCPAHQDEPEPHRVQSPHMVAASFRLVSFVALAVAATGLWVGLFRSIGDTVTATPAIPAYSSQSIFAPAARPGSGLAVRGLVRNRACADCIVHVGSGGLVRAEVPSGAGKRTAYALLDLGKSRANGQVFVHDVIGFGRGETPTRPVRLLQVLDSSRRVIFELVARPDRQLYLTSPAGGLRAAPLVQATGAVVPNDGVAGVAVDVAAKANAWVLVSVNGLRTAAKRGLAGARTGPPRFVRAGVIGYKAPSHGPGITATHAQVSVSTSAAPAPPAPAPAAQPSPAPQSPKPAIAALSPLAPPTISGRAVVGHTLTADPGSWSDASATFSYAWERCDGNGSCTSTGGADGKTYDLTANDLGAFVRVRVTAHLGDATASRASAAVGPVAPAVPTVLVEPRISGDAVVGAQLRADPGTWSDPNATFTFVWQRCDQSRTCTRIDEASGATYTPSPNDLGSSILVEVTASNAAGANTEDSAPTDVVVSAPPAVVSAPSVSGDGVVGSSLVADPGVWSDPGAVFTYAWLRCDDGGACTTIEGVSLPGSLVL